MPLETIVMSYVGVLVGALAATLVVSLCVILHYAVKLIQPFLWEVFDPYLPQGY